MKIVVLGGGISTERHVALVTATSACQALRRRGHKAVFVDLFFGMENYDKPLEQAFDEPDGLCGNVAIETEAPDLDAVRRSRRYQSPGNLGSGVAEICALADCVFLGLHGRDGEDGKIQSLLDLIGVPYTGSGPLASAIAMDKDTAKRILKAAGVRTPVWQVHDIPAGTEALRHLADTLPVPCVVKVYDGGSSLGVKFPNNHDEMFDALNEISCFGSRFILEEKISGRELTVPVLDGRALSPIEIVSPTGEFDYVAKYQSGDLGAREICPADLTEEEEQALRSAAEQVHQVLDLRVYSRSDFILDASGRVWFLEVNTLQGMTPTSLIPKAAAVEGISYDELIEKIVLLSLRENRG
ncbi:MAG: D-alanine--D-alanine ligase [Candidatus Limivicinus sp.]